MSGAGFGVVALLAVGLAGTVAGAAGQDAAAGEASKGMAQGEPAAAAGPAAQDVPSVCRTPGQVSPVVQLSVEKFLRNPPADVKVPGLLPSSITADGKSSAADCAGIVAFQKTNGISPANGFATVNTLAITNRFRTVDTAACKAGKSVTTVCVDQSSQTMWVVKDGENVLGPRPIRTGKKVADDRTPNGSFSVTAKKRHTVSSIYHEPLPYWQQFNGPFGFHQTTSYLYGDVAGSHGCVNMLPADASKLFKLTELGSKVHIFGEKPDN